MNEKYIKRIAKVTSVLVASAITMALVHNNQEVLAYKRTQQSLSNEVLRFHVLANSDTNEDQELKLEVKDRIIEYMKEELGENESLSYTKLWAENNLSQLDKIASEYIKSKGYDYTTNVELAVVEFPTKTYGDVTFPAGEYEALRIQIGDAKGENWWCCLYPNLCFIDATYAVVSEEGKEELETVLDEDEYEMITTATEFKFKWFFFGRN